MNTNTISWNKEAGDSYHSELCHLVACGHCHGRGVYYSAPVASAEFLAEHIG